LQRRFRLQDSAERATEFLAERAGRRPIFHVDDRLVVDVEQQVVRQAGGAGHLFGVSVIAGAGDVAEKVGLALGTGRVEGRRLAAQPIEHLAERRLDARFESGETLALDQAEAGPFEIVELLQKLFEPECPLERGEEFVERGIYSVGFGKRATEQREPGVDPRLLARDPRRGAVVRARIGDAAPDYIAVLVEKNRLGGG
jgi:hypothetical protein